MYYNIIEILNGSTVKAIIRYRLTHTYTYPVTLHKDLYSGKYGERRGVVGRDGAGVQEHGGPGQGHGQKLQERVSRTWISSA